MSTLEPSHFSQGAAKDIAVKGLTALRTPSESPNDLLILRSNLRNREFVQALVTDYSNDEIVGLMGEAVEYARSDSYHPTYLDDDTGATTTYNFQSPQERANYLAGLDSWTANFQGKVAKGLDTTGIQTLREPMVMLALRTFNVLSFGNSRAIETVVGAGQASQAVVGLR